MKRVRKKTVLLSILTVLMIASVLVMFLIWPVIRSASNVTYLEDGLYFMEYSGDYGLEDFLAQGGGSSDMAVADFVIDHLFHGLVTLNLQGNSFGCSTLSVSGPDGTQLFGRNFDWGDCAALIVQTHPGNGYASISTVNMDFLNLGPDLSEGASVRLVSAAAPYAPVEDILQIAADRGEPPLLVVCDEISDPHNLGAIIRTAECAGAHGVIIPKRRSAGLTAVVAKTSAGAVSYLPVARVPNIPSLLKDLQKRGLWIFGTAAGGTTALYDADLRSPAAIVIGSEGDGMGRLVQESCDFLVSIPMKGRISSLNASAAAAILLYEALRQRG